MEACARRSGQGGGRESRRRAALAAPGDEFLRSLLALPELAVVDESCAAERQLHDRLVAEPAGAVAQPSWRRSPTPTRARTTPSFSTFALQSRPPGRSRRTTSTSSAADASPCRRSSSTGWSRRSRPGCSRAASTSSSSAPRSCCTGRSASRSSTAASSAPIATTPTGRAARRASSTWWRDFALGAGPLREHARSWARRMPPLLRRR